MRRILRFVSNFNHGSDKFTHLSNMFADETLERTLWSSVLCAVSVLCDTVAVCPATVCFPIARFPIARFSIARFPIVARDEENVLKVLSCSRLLGRS